MTLTDSMRLAVAGLRGSILRTLLTIMSMAVGVSAVLTVMALSDAGENRVEDEIANLGVNKVWIRPASENSILKSGDAASVSAAVQAPACASAYTVANIYYANKSALVQVAGFDSMAGNVHSPKVMKGRMLCASDFNGASSVCLIDEVLDDYLGGDMIGEYLRVSNRRIRVVGVIKPMSLQMMSGGHGMMLLPLGSYLDTFAGGIAEITVSVQRGQQASEVAELAASVLGKEDYRTDTLEKEINAAREIVRIFVAVLLCVAIVCMISGGIGVMNILLVSVRERRKEIGLIKAIGGTGGQVLCLFLLEAAAYAMLGGMMGVLFGQGLIILCNRLIRLDASLQIGTTVWVLIFAALLGIGFGTAPALEAASMQPVDSLRGE